MGTFIWNGGGALAAQVQALFDNLGERRDRFAAISRQAITVANFTPASQRCQLAYFTAPRSALVSTLGGFLGATAAGATPTLIRFGLYRENSDGSLTLIGSTDNDTALLTATFAENSKAMTAPVMLSAGARYAVAILTVSAAAMPSFLASGSSIQPSQTLASARQSAYFAGQSDLPATIANGSLVGSNGTPMFYAH